MNEWKKMKIMNYWLALFFCVGCVVTGCSDDSVKAGNVTVADASGDVSLLGIGGPPGAEDGFGAQGKDVKEWTLDAQVAGDSGEGTSDSDAEGNSDPLPGEFGYPCDGNENCLSGFCVSSETGKVCTEACLENCPQGWECAQVSGLGGDVIYICLSLFANLCKPCTSSEECGATGGLEGNACVDSGGNGSYCGVSCELDEDCPEDYVCQDVVLDTGTESKQCIRATGACACTDPFIQEEASTECYKSNDLGACYGTMVCGPDGLTECDAEPGCTNYWLDQDNDGYGLGIAECLCESPGVKYVTQGGDCNDSTASVSPEASEICNGIDDDCNNEIDEYGAIGCQAFFEDLDEDGYGNPESPICACELGVKLSPNDDDCNDETELQNPDIEESCNGIDDNCDGTIDEENALGCQVFFFDQDNDGYGLGDTFKCLCESEWPYSAPAAGDCNDDIETILPFATELCDGIDNDCDSETDEGAPEDLCGVVDNGLAECVNGICDVTDCDPGFYDIDFQPLNGCECVANSVEVSGPTCQDAVDLGTVSDEGVTVQRQGNAVYPDESDWYQVFGSDGPDAGCDTYHMRVRFLWNPNDAYTFDIHRGSCAAGDQECVQGVDYAFFTDFNDAAGNIGECPCVVDPFFTTDGVHECTDNSDTYFIRVYRKPEVPPDCQGYALEITNGVY